MTDRHDLTTGNVGKKLLVFSLPILAIDFLQAIYNMVDMIIVGQFIGSTGMSAVSIGGQIPHLILAVCNGLCNASAACIGHLFGAKKHEDIRKTVGTLVSFVTILSLFFSAAIIFFRHPILRLLNTPAECYDETARYLVICMSGTIFVYVYNALSAALRGIGESLNPMVYVLITTIENIILDLLFVRVFRWGAAGAAWATIICQATSMILVMLYVRQHTDIFDFKPRSFRIFPQKLKNIIQIGLPQSIQYLSTNISFLLIASLINTYGVVAAAAAGAANKIWSFGTLPGRAFMSGIISFTSQNHPGKNYKRILKALGCGIIFSLAISSIFFVLCQTIPSGMYSLFTSDAGVAEIGITYLRIYAICFFDEVIMFCIFGVLTGSGYTPVTMVCSIISALGIRAVLAYVFSASIGFNGIAIAYSAAPLVGIIIGGYYLITGRWKKSRINIST